MDILLSHIIDFGDYIVSFFYNIMFVSYGDISDILLGSMSFDFSLFNGTIESIQLPDIIGFLDSIDWLIPFGDELTQFLTENFIDIFFKPFSTFGYGSIENVPFVLSFMCFLIRGAILVAIIKLIFVWN